MGPGPPKLHTLPTASHSQKHLPTNPFSPSFPSPLSRHPKENTLGILGSSTSCHGEERSSGHGSLRSRRIISQAHQKAIKIHNPHSTFDCHSHTRSAIAPSSRKRRQFDRRHRTNDFALLASLVAHLVRGIRQPQFVFGACHSPPLDGFVICRQRLFPTSVRRGRSPLLQSSFSNLRHSIHAELQSIQTDITGDSSIIPRLINSFHRGHNWNTLSEQFSSLKLTNHFVQKVLLELKEPINSKTALSFFHWSSNKMHFQHGLSSYCIMIHILSKAGLAKDAKVLLHSVLTMDFGGGKSCTIVVLNALLESYKDVDSAPFVFDLFLQICAKLRMIDDVLDAIKLLLDNGFSSSVISFNTMLDVIQKSDKVHLVWRVYEHMIETRICPNEVTTQVMISALCKEGKLERFLDIVDKMQGKRCSVPQLIVNTCLVYEMLEENRIEDGLVLLKWMLRKNMVLDTIAYSLVVFAKVNMGNLDVAKETYNEMLKRGFNENAFVCSLFVGVYSRVGRIDEAVASLEAMERLGLKPSDEALNQLMQGFSLHGQLENGLVFCQKMVGIGLLPNCSSINLMFRKLCENGKTRQADEMLTILLDKGFSPNSDTYSLLIHGYSKDEDIEALTKLLFEMEYHSISPNMLGFSSLIIVFCKYGKLKEAEKYLERMRAQSLTPDSDVYEKLIVGHLQSGSKARAHQLHCEMVGTAHDLPLI